MAVLHGRNCQRCPRSVRADSRDERWALVQGELQYCIPPGRIEWREHEKAWVAYNAKYRNLQSAERIHERGGFGFFELYEFLGHPPETWRKR